MRQSTGYPLATNPVIEHFNTFSREVNFDLECCIDKMVSFLAVAITSHWAIDLVETLLQSYPREAKADFIITRVRGSIKNIVWRSYRKTIRGENYS